MERERVTVAKVERGGSRRAKQSASRKCAPGSLLTPLLPERERGRRRVSVAHLTSQQPLPCYCDTTTVPRVVRRSFSGLNWCRTGPPGYSKLDVKSPHHPLMPAGGGRGLFRDCCTETHDNQ